jgi:tRNA (guanine37-N1)-methyltransferase
MILRADILAKALKSINPKKEAEVILTSASGQVFNQKKARDLSKLKKIIIICGHYEGVDQRFIDKYVDQEISVGDFVLTGGELPALMIADAIIRLIPGVLKKEEAVIEESFSQNTLEYPHYTRPGVFEKVKVPEVLSSGHHAKVAKWRLEKSLEKTKKVRPDLIKRI